MGDGTEVANPAKMPALVRPGKSPEMAVHGPMDTMGLLILPNELLIEILEIVVEEKSDIRSWFNLMRINRRIAGLMNGVRGSITADPASFSKYSLVTKRSAALFRRANLLPLLYSETQFGHFSDGLAVQLNDLLSEQQMTRAVMRDGSTPLIFACREGLLAAVRFLVQRAQSFDSGASSAFEQIAAQQPPGAVALTRSQSVLGKMLRARDSQKRTALHSACDARENALEIVMILLAAAEPRPNLLEFVVSTADKDGETPLYIACKWGRLDMVQVLVGNGADLDKADNRGDTPLWIACALGHINVVRLLVEKEADLNKTVDGGETPLFMACLKGRLEVAQELVNAGADLNKASLGGTTPLLIACQFGRLDVVRLLVEKGADLNKANNYGDTPLHMAHSKDHDECADLLRAAGARE